MQPTDAKLRSYLDNWKGGQTMTNETIVGKAYSQVMRFQAEVTRWPTPPVPQVLDGDGFARAQAVVLEELHELEEACKAGDVHAAADALVDLAYFALGRLVEMGVPPGPAFDRVHEANMQKVAGDLSKRPGWKGHDAVKPLGWRAPDLHDLLAITSDDVHALKRLSMTVEEDSAFLQNVSPAFREAAALRARKGKDYNDAGLNIAEYFPFGEVSFVQMLYVKALRLVSLARRPRETVHEPLRDTVIDLLNYASYFVEWLDGVLPGQAKRPGDRS